jgi:hypothetical protein
VLNDHVCQVTRELSSHVIILLCGASAGQERGADRAGQVRDGDLVLLPPAARLQRLQGAWDA